MAQKGKKIQIITLDDDEIDAKAEDTPSMIGKIPSIEEEDFLKTIPRIFLTSLQRRKLEKAFKKDQYPRTTDKEALATSIGVSMKQVQNWFNNRRATWRLQNIMSTDLNEEIDNLRAKYHNLFSERDKLARELEEERRKNSQLTEEVKKLTRKWTQMEDLKKRISRELERETVEDQT